LELLRFCCVRGSEITSTKFGSKPRRRGNTNR
jgi:hypothetical protein